MSNGEFRHSNLIYDWNSLSGPPVPLTHTVLLDDETLRDGLQSPSVKDPPISQKIELLHLMEDLGINMVDIGLPGAGPRARLFKQWARKQSEHCGFENLEDALEGGNR